jgi:hypothetical protein
MKTTVKDTASKIFEELKDVFATDRLYHVIIQELVRASSHRCFVLSANTYTYVLWIAERFEDELEPIDVRFKKHVDQPTAERITNLLNMKVFNINAKQTLSIVCSTL